MVNQLTGGLDSRQLVRFVIAGGISTALNLSLFYVLTDKVHVWYIFSSVFAYVCSFCVHASLQKWWTFRSVYRGKKATAVQFTKYLLLRLSFMGLSTGSLWLLVEQVQVPHLVAQVLIICGLSVLSFFPSRWIFR